MDSRYPALKCRRGGLVSEHIDVARRELWRAYECGTLSEDELASTLERLDYFNLEPEGESGLHTVLRPRSEQVSQEPSTRSARTMLDDDDCDDDLTSVTTDITVLAEPTTQRCQWDRCEQLATHGLVQYDAGSLPPVLEDPDFLLCQPHALALQLRLSDLA